MLSAVTVTGTFNTPNWNCYAGAGYWTCLKNALFSFSCFMITANNQALSCVLWGGVTLFSVTYCL